MKKAILFFLTALIMLCACGKEPMTEEKQVNIAVFSSFADSRKDNKETKMELTDGSTTYVYNVTKYAANELEALLENIRSDKSPDLLLSCGDIIPTGAYFDNLYEYLDTDDSLKRDSFIPGFLNALEIDGGLYELWSDTELTAIAVSGSGQEATNATAENTLSFIADAGLSAFVDFGTMTCHFDSDEFMDLLRLSGSMGARELAWLTVDCMDAYTGYSLTDDMSYCFRRANLKSGMSIPVNSHEKEGAWLFIKNALALDTQKSKGMPVINEAYEWKKASLSDEQAAMLDTVLASAPRRATNAGEELRNIVISTGEKYLSGELSLEAAAELIQSSAGEYLRGRVC